MASKFKTVFIIAVLFLPLVSFGQMGSMAAALSSELNMEVIPDYPRPDEPVSINLSMYTEDLDSATITWYKNGVSVLSGKGEKYYSFQTGNLGEEINIRVAITLSSGRSFTKNITLAPASVDLIWEANSYVPPFYKGKALHSYQGSLKVVAMPEFVSSGRRISPQNLIYEWSNDVSAYQSQSGYGKYALVLSGSILGRGESITVKVRDPQSGLAAIRHITISPQDPQIIFYENSPYYGHIFDMAIGSSLRLVSDEIQLSAAPYYFSREDAGLLKYEWRLNNQASPSLAGSRTAIFKKPDNQSGRSSIFLRMENGSRILQQAERSLTINFED